jgi:23S rRNA (guanine2445-N2)-methyltransferase / 23S rRNA (guanine2069-N7)-methyltransferase
MQDLINIDEKWATQSKMLVNRVEKNFRRLGPWAKREQLTCFRIYDRDIPEIPLAADWYDGRLHISFYEREATLEAARQKQQRGYLATTLGRALGVEPENIFVKSRRRAAGGTQYKPLDAGHNLIPVKENGLTFFVNLTDYVDTGLFLDHRMLRRTVMREAKNKRFLNLFAYTGAFSVYAAAGGARSTVTVDLSYTYLDWAQKNMLENGFWGENHQFVRDDILSALLEPGGRETYDLVVLDPPTVSKSKSMARDLDIQRDHPALLNGVLRRLFPGGTVYFSTNFKKFKLRRDEIDCDDILEITEQTRPFDFRNRFVHHCFRLTRKK